MFGDNGRFKWVSMKDVNVNLTAKDKSKASGGVARPTIDKLCLIQSGGVEVHCANQIWEYSLSLIIALAPNQ